MLVSDLGRESRERRRRLVGFEQRLLARARRLGLPPGSVVAVGFSGGGDSLALAAALGRVAEQSAMRPVLLHVDHRLRESSGEEQARAGALARALSLPFWALRAGDDPRRRHPGVGVEEAARRERYRLLAGAATELGAAMVALAHHETDHEETVLLRLLRGAGVAGAAGMGERAELPVPWWSDRRPPVQLQLWRPLLGESRRAVRAYAATLGLDPVEDPSNEDLGPRRNALRVEALPLLERIVPGATAGLARYGALAAADDETLEAIAAVAAARAIAPDGGLVAAAVAGEARGVRRRMVRRWLRAAGRSSATADRVDAILRLVETGRGGSVVEVGQGLAVVVRGGVLRIEAGAGAAGEEEGT